MPSEQRFVFVNSKTERTIQVLVRLKFLCFVNVFSLLKRLAVNWILDKLSHFDFSLENFDEIAEFTKVINNLLAPQSAFEIAVKSKLNYLGSSRSNDKVKFNSWSSYKIVLELDRYFIGTLGRKLYTTDQLKGSSTFTHLDCLLYPLKYMFRVNFDKCPSFSSDNTTIYMCKL